MRDGREIRAKSGTNLEGTVAHNRRVVIDALRVNGALTRAELARATRLSAQTASNIVAALQADGLVASDGPVRIARGQPASPFRLVPAGAYAIGVQIDRHVARAVAVDFVGVERVTAESALPAGGPAAGVPAILDLVAVVRRALAAMDAGAEARLVGLGVAMPGPFGPDPDVTDPWMMPAWQTHPLREDLARGTGLAVTIQNDAGAAATQERLAGVAAGLDHFVYLYLGYGLGAGLVVGGELYAGARGNAGEIGLALALGPDGAAGGPLEHVASLAALGRALGLDPAAPDLYPRLTRAVETAAPGVEEWLDAAVPRLRWAVQLAETLIDPQTIVLGGPLPPPLYERIEARLAPLLPSPAERFPRALPRLVLGKADPFLVAHGAASEPIARTFDPRFSALLKRAADGVGRAGG